MSVLIDAHRRAHGVLRDFAKHLRTYLLIPSGRYAVPGRHRARATLAGCFTYEPPAGLAWTE